MSPRWEYLRCSLNCFSNGIIIEAFERGTRIDSLSDAEHTIWSFASYMNELGKQGWEMINFYRYDNDSGGFTEVYYFKRSFSY